MPAPRMIEIPAGHGPAGPHRIGRLRLGQRVRGAHRGGARSSRSASTRSPIGEYLEFVRQGAAPPFFWVERGGRWHYRGMFSEVPLPLDCAGVRDHERGRGLRPMARQATTHGAAISPRGLRSAPRVRQSRISATGIPSPVTADEQEWHRGPAADRQRLGVDFHGVCALSGLQAVSVLPELLRAVLRRRTLRPERSLTAHGGLFSAVLVPQLVPAVVSLHLRDFPAGGFLMYAQALDSEFARDVRAGLTRTDQKTLPCRYFYDDLGSALFEAITCLPEYGLTRADARILRHALGRAGWTSAGEPVDRGTGQRGRESRPVPCWSRSGGGRRVVYYPIDVSASALAKCASDLGPLGRFCRSKQLPGWPALGGGAPQRRDRRCCCCFSAAPSATSNPATPSTSCGSLRAELRPGDALLLGTDLVKPVKDLLAAYDDPTGVTAAFNLNLLARINRELDGDFDLRQFAHVSPLPRGRAAHRDAPALARPPDRQRSARRT